MTEQLSIEVALAAHRKTVKRYGAATRLRRTQAPDYLQLAEDAARNLALAVYRECDGMTWNGELDKFGDLHRRIAALGKEFPDV